MILIPDWSASSVISLCKLSPLLSSISLNPAVMRTIPFTPFSLHSFMILGTCSAGRTMMDKVNGIRDPRKGRIGFDSHDFIFSWIDRIDFAWISPLSQAFHDMRS